MLKHVIVGSLLAQAATAAEVPPYLKDAIIEVKLKTGDLYAFPAKDWTVVKRDNTRIEANTCPVCRSSGQPRDCPTYVPSSSSAKAEIETLRQKVDNQAKEITRLTQLLTEASANARAQPTSAPPDGKMLNRISVTAGLGIQYAIVQDELGSYLDSSLGPVVGVEYSRLIFDGYSASFGVVSNQTYQIGAGYNW